MPGCPLLDTSLPCRDTLPGAVYRASPSPLREAGLPGLQLPGLPTDVAWGLEAAPVPQMAPQHNVLLAMDSCCTGMVAQRAAPGLAQVPVIPEDIFQRALQQAMDSPEGQLELKY